MVLRSGPLQVRLVFACALVCSSPSISNITSFSIITLPGIVIGFAFGFHRTWLDGLSHRAAGWRGSLYLVVLYFWVGTGGLGGRSKMLSMIGAFPWLSSHLVTLMIASLTGSVVGVGLIAAGRGSMKYALPFGCFLAVGAAAAATIGPALLEWYLRTL